MRLALDTNAYSGFMRGDAFFLRAVQRATDLLIPLPVLAELRAGFLHGDCSQENEKRLELFLNEQRVGVLSPDEGTTHLYARLYKQLRKQGTPIPTNDLWIASLVMQHDLVLVSSDPHFSNLPQVPLFE